MNAWRRRLAAGVLLLALQPAWAGRNCEARLPDAWAVQRGLELAERTEALLRASGARVVVLALALRRTVPGGWGLPLVAVLALYALAKLLELGDHAVFGWTQGWVSGHSLKHGVAALAAWPVLAVMHNVGQSGKQLQGESHVRP